MSWTRNMNVCLFSARRFSSVKPAVIPDQSVINDIENNELKPRKHPGIMVPKNVMLPEAFIKAMFKATEDYPVKSILEDSKKFAQHLHGRKAPMEQEELVKTAAAIQGSIIEKNNNVKINSIEDERRYKQMVGDKTKYVFNKKVYNWNPIKYDTYNSLLYLFARAAPEYSVLTKIFGEINIRHPNFKPRSLFDFGSGIGTAMWAANTYWQKEIYEYYNVDISRDMNDLSEILLKGGKGNSNYLPKGVFYRQFLPAEKTTYDIVVSAFSMLELPNLNTRLQTILKLWNKTENYLVVVEQGTNAGFRIVNELRDFILEIKKDCSVGHVFSPCPHDHTCPRFVLDDGTPCNFEVSYHTPPVGGSSEVRKELYSYVVLKKGKRKNDLQWPRLVRPTLVRSKHSICRMCTASGKLAEVIFTASKHGKTTYYCARASKWGDFLPMRVEVQDMDELDTCDKEIIKK